MFFGPFDTRFGFVDPENIGKVTKNVEIGQNLKKLKDFHGSRSFRDSNPD